MQIVRDLGGYTLGRSDLVRRAMSKKKEKVMEQERKNFVYGNKDEGVPGCISKGISEETSGVDLLPRLSKKSELSISISYFSQKLSREVMAAA